MPKFEVGDVVKVSENAERFWVIIESIEEDGYIARVDNDLVNKHFFKDGDKIRINDNDIIEQF